MPRPLLPRHVVLRPVGLRPLVLRPVVLRPLVLGIAYGAVSAAVTLVTSFGTETGAVFWPGAGLTVAALLLRPRPEWPALLGAVFVAELGVDLATGFGLVAGLSFAVANCAEPLAAALLLQRRGRAAPDLGRLPDLARFVGAAVLAGPALGALVGTALPALLLGDPWLPRLPRWLLGDAVGVLALAPCLLTWHRAGDVPARRQAPVLAGLAAVALAAAGPWSPPAEIGMQYVLIPVLVLVAIRLRSSGAALGVLVVALVVETFSAASTGPFAAGGEAGGLVAGQTFLAMTALSALLVAALTNDLVARERTEALLRAEALEDPLTGLGNRRLLQERLGHALDRLRRREAGSLAIVSIDLDNLKRVNDRHGHAAGDAVLVEVARRIVETVRVGDTAARVGGDEFVVVAEDLVDPGGAAALAARLSWELARPMAFGDAILEIGASVGTAAARGGEHRPEDLLAEADGSMYRVKARHRRGEVRL